MLIYYIFIKIGDIMRKKIFIIGLCFLLTISTLTITAEKMNKIVNSRIILVECGSEKYFLYIIIQSDHI